ncbi:diguanylate cyclase [Idiomarina loihiensis]|uniref:ligand-binding sensor domain-containing diguanylate cyclase n=1 Tax=Idiomarina loihiensis TaxID=135577 RepID=UPI00384F53A4
MRKYVSEATTYLFVFTIIVAVSLTANARPIQQHKEFSRVAQNMAARQSSVYQVTQDTSGLLWLATDTDGILRYDGYQFSRWTEAVLPSVKTADFSKLLIDDDIIWAATWGHGLAAWNSKTQKAHQFKQTKHSSSLKNNRVQTLFKDSQNRLWVGSLGGLQYIKPGQTIQEDLTFKFLAEQHPLNNLRIWWITESSSALWVASSQGVFKVSLDLKTWEQYFVDPDNVGENRANEVRTIEFINDTIWIGTAQGLFYLDNETDTFNRIVFKGDNAPTSLRVNDIVSENNDHEHSALWAGASEGLYQVNIEDKTFVKQDNGWSALKNIDIRYLHFDNTDTLWIGTRSQGLFKGVTTVKNFTDPLAKIKTLTNLPATDNPVQAVHYTNNNDLWLGNSAGLYKRDAITQLWQFFPFNDEYPVREVNVLFTDSHGDLWVGTNEELFRTPSDNPKLDPVDAIKTQLGLEENTVTAIHESDDDTVLLGLWGQGIVKFDRASGMFSWHNQTFGDLRGDQAYSIVTVEGSGIYSATRYSGLLDLTNQSLVEGLFNNETLLCAYSFRPNTIWLCSDNGLWEYNTQSKATQHFTESDGLPSNRILGITADKTGNLWVITSLGLARLDLTSHKIITLNEADGLPSSNFIEHAIDSSSTGEVTIGSTAGASSFSPEQVKIKEVVANTALISIEVNDENITDRYALTSKRFILPEDYQSFSLSFAITDFRAPEKNSIRYQLSGVNDQWSEWTTDLSLDFSGLSPGEYQLTVQGRNSQGIESKKPLTLSLVIEAPWWYNFWTFFVGTSVFIVGIYVAIRLRTKTLERANLKLEAEIAQRTNELKFANEKLQKLSETDPLTGLLNRRGFETNFCQLIQEHQKSGKPLSILLIDVDHFKKFNDKYGHNAGDSALKTVSRTLSDGVREQDIVARWGGEEFALALPNLDIKKAEETANRLRLAIANQELDCEGIPVAITATIGISSFNAEEDNLAVWIKAADDALYQGKNTGRNRVVAANTNPFK